MVAVENLNFEAVSFDYQIFDFHSLDPEVGNRKIAVDKKNLNSAAESVDMTVVVAYTNFADAFATEVVDNSVEVL